MIFTTIKVVGTEAIQTLEQHRSRYPAGPFPFLIGGDEELEILEETIEGNEQTIPEILQLAQEVDLASWIANRRKKADEYEFSADDTLGEWPGEVSEKGSIGLHKDMLTGEFKPEVHLGLASIEEPWHLPAVLRYGAWNECPRAEVHCAFHRYWQRRFGAEITGMSGSVVECLVRNPPCDQETAIALAWEQYWYCNDIVDQGCGSVAHLAATLLNSNYWFFWWD